MNITNAISKTVSTLGSIGGAASDIIEGTIDTGAKAKKALDNEVNSLQSERDIENAVSRILAKATAIKCIAKELNISLAEAEELLIKELQNGSKW